MNKLWSRNPTTHLEQCSLNCNGRFWGSIPGRVTVIRLGFSSNSNLRFSHLNRLCEENKFTKIYPKVCSHLMWSCNTKDVLNTSLVILYPRASPTLWTSFSKITAQSLNYSPTSQPLYTPTHIVTNTWPVGLAQAANISFISGWLPWFTWTTSNSSWPLFLFSSLAVLIMSWLLFLRVNICCWDIHRSVVIEGF